MGFVRAALAALPFLVAPALAADLPVAAGTGGEITVYPGDLALVRDHRAFRLPGPDGHCPPLAPIRLSEAYETAGEGAAQ